MSNAVPLLLSIVFSFAALVLACIACAGSTRNYSPINKIYVAQINLTGLSLSTVLPSISSSTTLSSVLPSYFNIGLWSYCLEDSSKTVTSCTSPSGIETFNLKNLLYDNIVDNSVLELIDSIASIILPDSLENNLGGYNALVKCAFITLIIGIVLSFICFLLSFCRSILHIRLFKWFAVLLSFISFVVLLVSAGTSMAPYLYIRNILKDNYSDYGISLSLGRVYLGLLWGSVVAAFFNFISWCFVRPTPRVVYVQPQMIEKREML